MSRRLRKTIRAGKHTNRREAANLPKLNFDGLEAQVARGFARKRSIRAALMMGTALSAGVLTGTVIATTMALVDPAEAACSGSGTGISCTGNFPNGIAYQDVVVDTTITTTGTTLIGGNSTTGDGIELTTITNGLTLGVVTSAGTTIGLPTYGNVTHDGIHVYSFGNNETIFIESAATINLGNGTTTHGNDGIYARINGYGNNTLSVQNTGPIGNSTNPVGYNGIFAGISANGGSGSVQTTYVSNTMPIFAAHDGIHAYAIDHENNLAYGNSGTTSTTVVNTGYISAGHQGIHAYSFTQTYDGASALATVEIVNSGAIVSNGDGLHGVAIANSHYDDEGTYSSTARAVVTITNSGAITSANGFGIYGNATADANGFGNFLGFAQGGTAFATTAISNSGAITSHLDGIRGKAYASAFAESTPGNATGGTAGAYVVISNSGAIKSSGDGIDGYSRAEAVAYSESSGNSTGGVANALTTMSNSGAITSTDTGIYGGARAKAGANATGNATGGTSEATVVISNSATITSSDGFGIFGNASGNSSAYGTFTAHGGYAAAFTTITNSGGITSVDDAINGNATARAGADSGAYISSHTTVATGGSAIASVTITNSGALTSTNGNGITGNSYASAFAGSLGYLLGEIPFNAFTATGGTVEATTTIINSGAIRASDYGIRGYAGAVAEGVGSFSHYTIGNKSYSGSGTGGYAGAIVYIVNTATAAIIAGGEGIEGTALAFADGFGDKATGGVAVTDVTILNGGNITAYEAGIVGEALASANGGAFFRFDPYTGNLAGRFGYGGTASTEVTIANTGTIHAEFDGIYGNATALALGVGDLKGYGGTAYASVAIANFGNIATSEDGGIVGKALANASGIADFRVNESGYSIGIAKGGTATAFVDIVNTYRIVSNGDGIYGAARAYANAYGGNSSGGNGTGSGTAGFAHAATNIFNAPGGAIVSGEKGIDAYSKAAANGHGYNAKGGQAFASTDVYNNAKIISKDTGIYAGARAYANAEGAYSVFGSSSAGIASAEVLVISAAGNGSFPGVNSITGIKTYNGDSPGIYGYTKAEANADGFAATGGTASAQTYIYNFATIITHGDSSQGIRGRAKAYAESNAELEGTGGTAYAKVFIANHGPITTYGDGADGIFALSKAVTDGYTPGAATAVTVVYNFGNITTHGDGAHGIDARSYAFGDASAYTTVHNNGSITTLGPNSKGIKAVSYAYDQLGNATAVTKVYNRGVIITHGYNSDGIYATASANSPTHTAFAYVTVTNSGVIHTFGGKSAAIEVNAATYGYSEPSHITVNNTYGGFIKAGSFPYIAVLATGANTTINNRGYIYGNVKLPSGKVNIFNNYATGTWVMAGNSRFGGNEDSAVNNSGIVANLQHGYFKRNVYLNGLENFNNTGNNGAGVTTGGLVTMINGYSYNRIVISNYADHTFFNGGAGSRLGVDAFLGTGGSADVLQVGTKASPGYVTGNTTVIVNNTNTGLGGFNQKGIPVAESSGAVSAFGGTSNVASNFTTATIHQGLFDWNLFFLPKDAAGNPGPAGFNTWFLASTPSTAAEELPRLLTAAQDIWHNAAGVWLDRTADLRDYYYMTTQACGPRKGGGADLAVKAPPCVPVHGQPGAGVWFRAYGDWIKNNGTVTASAPGQTLANLSHDVHYTQDTGGVQIGADFAAFNWASGTLFAGILGGAENSTVNFNSGTSVHFQGGNIGTYATYLNAGWFADALFLANFMTADFNSSPDLQGLGVTGFGTNTNVQQFGGHLDMGYRFQWNPWFFEPQATIEVVHTEFCGSTAINCFNNPGVVFANTVVSMDDTSVRGRLGGRVGTTWLWSGWTVEPSITGSVWETFTGNNVASLTSNGFVLDLNDVNQHKTQGEVGGMVNVFGGLGSPWSAFVKGDYRFASGYSDGSIKGGLRYQWGVGY